MCCTLDTAAAPPTRPPAAPPTSAAAAAAPPPPPAAVPPVGGTVCIYLDLLSHLPYIKIYTLYIQISATTYITAVYHGVSGLRAAGYCLSDREEDEHVI